MKRERQVNGPILVVVFSLLTWAVSFGILFVRIADGPRGAHTHTEECWDK